MRTFTFVELQNIDTGSTRMVALRGDGRKANALSRFIQRRGLVIIAMYQVEREDLTSAREWLDWVIG